MNGDQARQKERIRSLLAARRVLRGYSVVGLVFTVGLGVISYAMFADGAARAVCSTGATASLFGSAVALNMSDRIRRGRPVYALLFSGASAVMAILLVGVSFMAIERGIPGAWSPFMASGLLFVLAIMAWRLTQ